MSAFGEPKADFICQRTFGRDDVLGAEPVAHVFAKDLDAMYGVCVGCVIAPVGT
jgi:hypothetical protein